MVAPACSSTAATGTAPSRRSGRPITTAPRHVRVSFQRRLHGLRQHLEAAPDDRVVGPPEDPEEAVCIDAREVGGARPRVARRAVRPSPRAVRVCRRPTTSPSLSETTRSWQPGWARPTLPRFAAPERAVVREVPTGDAAAELRRAIGDEDRDPVAREERVRVVGIEGRRAADHGLEARQVLRVEVGGEHHAQRRRHQARVRGWCRRTASSQASTRKRSSRQKERPS